MHRRNDLIFFLLLLFSRTILPQSEFSEGIKYYENREWDKSVSYFEKQIGRNPNSALCYNYLGGSLIQKKEFNKAYTVLLKGIKLFPKELAILGNFVNTGIQTKKYEEPLKAALEALKNTTQETKVKELISLIYISQADDYNKSGNFDKAIAAANTASKYDAGNENIPFILVSANSGLQKNKEALEEAEKGIRRFPASIRLQLAHISALASVNEFEKALNAALKIEPRFKNDIDFQINLGMLYRTNFKIQEASALYEGLMAKFPKNEKAYDAAISYCESIGQKEKVREILEKKIKVFSRENEFKQKIAETFEEEGSNQKARNVYLTMLEKKDDPDIRLLLVYLYLRDSMSGPALAEIENILVKNKTYYEAHKIKTEYFLNIKNNDSAIASSGEFIKHYPKDFYSNLYLAKANFIKGDLAKAKEYAETARRISHKNPFPYEILAEININRDEYSEAFAKLDTLIESGIKKKEETEGKLNALAQGADISTGKINRTLAEKLKNELLEVKKSIQKGFVSYEKYSDKTGYKKLLDGLLQKFPKTSLVLNEAARFYEKSGNTDTAEFYYKKVVQYEPSGKEGHHGMMSVYIKKKNYTEIIKSCKRILAIDRNDLEAYDNIIEYSLKSGTQNELADDWLAVYKTDRKNLILKERLIELLHKSNRFDEAKQIIESKL